MYGKFTKTKNYENFQKISVLINTEISPPQNKQCIFNAKLIIK